ncbi:hypothetical protein M0812_29078 [Anaeramoeba flamelloides]|uniref:BTB domain-containing protein n=1 Tax=Anaeramoeba flamelloides TaxID=1746091 RepID=A0AAV7Y3K4_9EUKA|nr:hypothetical protein M0812_29078 [Anaeramoeba flamelloides]
MNFFYGIGEQTREFYSTLNKEMLPNKNLPFQLNNLNKMKMKTKIVKVSRTTKTLLFLNDKGKVFTLDKNGINTVEFEEIIFDISSGWNHHVASSQTKVYTWFDRAIQNNYSNNQLGRNFNTYNKFEPNPIDYTFSFPQVFASSKCTFVLEGSTLFACGLGWGGSVQYYNNSSKKVTQYLSQIHSPVESIYCHRMSRTFVIKYTQMQNSLCARVHIENKGLGNYILSPHIKQSKQKKIGFTKNNFIVYQAKDIYYYTIATYNKKNYIRIEKMKQSFFQTENILHIFGTEYCFYILLEDMSLYKLESLSHYKKGTYQPYAEYLCSFQNRKFINFLPMDGSECMLLFRDNFASDFLNLFKSNQFTDLEIRNQKIHQLLFSFRLGLPPDIYQDVIENKLTDKEFQHLILWVYTDLIRDWQIMEKLFKIFKIKDPLKKALINDMKVLAITDSTKDFILIAKNKKLKIHKFILQARSGLFFSMFDLINENEKCVHDYSDRSFRAVKIIVHFLYTNQFPVEEFEKESDLANLFQELEDAPDYYQMNMNCGFEDQLEKLQSKFREKLL